MNKKSFTLIELLVVIAIIGILSSLVIARFSDWGDNARIANTLQWSAGVHRTLGANLVGHWPLNGDVNDISGYNNHGEIVGSPEWVPGVSGTGNLALEFDGANDGINCGNDSSLDITDSITMAAWVKLNNYSFGGNNTDRGTITIKAYSYYMSVTSTTGKLASWFYGVDHTHRDSNSQIPLNEWTHVSITYDGSNIRWYINGILDKIYNDSGYIDVSVGTLGIGKEVYGDYGRIFNGLISDARIYDIALTSEEVGRIYAETKDKYLVYE